MAPPTDTLQRLWLIESTRYGVLPLDDQASTRCGPSLTTTVAASARVITPEELLRVAMARQ